jgi:hypothetical protein
MIKMVDHQQVLLLVVVVVPFPLADQSWAQRLRFAR